MTSPLPYILLVEDHDDLRDLVAELLEAQGYRVVAAHDGADAIALMRADAPGFVIMDLMMPSMSGWDLAAAMEAEPTLRDVPFCIVSAIGREEAKTRPNRASYWLRKPFNWTELFEIVLQHVPRPRPL